MDEGKDTGKDVEEDVHCKDTAPAESDVHKSPLTHCETVSLDQDVQLESKELEEMGLNMTIDNKVSVEHATVVEVVNANMDADANMDSNMKVNADNIGAEGEDNFMHFVAVNTNATDSVACNARVTASNIEPDISVDAKMVADADMTADINLDSGPNAAAIAKHDANSETVAVHIIDGNENFDVDASTFADAETNENSRSITDISNNSNVRHGNVLRDGSSIVPLSQVKSEDFHSEINANENKEDGVKIDKEIEGKVSKPDFDAEHIEGLKRSFLWGPCQDEGSDSGAEEDQAEFMKELEAFFKERGMEFKPPKFYGEGINCLKLWRAVAKLGGYDQVTTCKLWRQVGESFKPPKTCTTVSWTFRIFYEKALLEYEKYKMHGGELPLPDASFEEPPKGVHNQMQVTGNTTSGRALRDAAARAMQGWHSQRLLGNGEVGDPIIKDKNSSSTSKREKQLKRKKTNMVDRVDKAARLKLAKPQLDSMVIDLGPPADWVKVNVQKTKDCFEVYALVPGLLREEVRVQSDPAGRLVISGQPEHQDNPWGVTPFKKVVSLPSRIDPHQTSAVVTLHGQLFVRVPFESSDL